ncbi:MAG TPA: helix-turn-helix transcriptional regulator [Verrucomicrobiae bacterium]|jgi:transcriptional regulator with XRE-family HTH domain|nr:helix-turn-helix transcriptional regulator [Verrucomicrobiae bacterium]
MTTKHRFSNNLRLHRKKAGLRQREVARSLGLKSTDRISRWEHGTAVPHIVNLFRLAVIYDVSPQDLYQDIWLAIVQGIYARPPKDPPPSVSPEEGLSCHCE